MAAASEYLYLIALGSNQRHHSLGSPVRIVAHAFDALEMTDIALYAASSIITSRPIGPSQRAYANAAAIILTPLPPPMLLKRLKSLEAHFGRRRAGQKWRTRILDLDIILWSGGVYAGRGESLQIPHPEMQRRRFVLQPARKIAANWRDPISGMRIKHLFTRINRANRLDPMRAAN